MSMRRETPADRQRRIDGARTAAYAAIERRDGDPTGDAHTQALHRQPAAPAPGTRLAAYLRIDRGRTT
ncbi:MAG: hypothetical protein AAFR52_12065 [Pseudomonadota bacterium]